MIVILEMHQERIMHTAAPIARFVCSQPRYAPTHVEGHM